MNLIQSVTAGRWGRKYSLVSLVSILVTTVIALSGCMAIGRESTPPPEPVPTPVPEELEPAPEPTPMPMPPVKKEIVAHFGTFWVYLPPEDSFTIREVIGMTESWAVDMHNVAERSITMATLSLATDIMFDQLIPHPGKMGPPTY